MGEEQFTRDGFPFRAEIAGLCRPACAAIPVLRVARVSLDPMEVSMNPCSVAVVFRLRHFVRLLHSPLPANHKARSTPEKEDPSLSINSVVVMSMPLVPAVEMRAFST